jgi:integrase
VPLTEIAKWLGHADVRTTEGYIVAYRSDRQHTAPVPRALAGDAGQSTKTGALKRAAWRR